MPQYHVTKRIIVNTKALKRWMKENECSYRDLAERTGMSSTQAFNLLHKPIGGAVTIGYLMELPIENLFYLVKIADIGGKKKVVDAIPVDFGDSFLARREKL